MTPIDPLPTLSKYPTRRRRHPPGRSNVAAAMLVVGLSVAAAGVAGAADASEPSLEPTPWDYDPYQVLIWVAADDPATSAEAVERSLRTYLLRDFASIWRIDIESAPASVRTAVRRSMRDLHFESVAASDPVLAIKRDHPDAIRIRYAPSVARYVDKVYATPSRIDEAVRRGRAAGDETLGGAAENLTPIDGDATTLRAMWADEQTEAVLVSRGMASRLEEPEAKLVRLPVEGLVVEAADRYDKIYIVDVTAESAFHRVRAIELEALMRSFGLPVEETVVARDRVPAAIGRAVTRAFSPTVRIEEAGRRSAQGLVRAGGLLGDSDPPGAVGVGDVLTPMIRKDNRNGKPIRIGPIDWAYLQVTEKDGAKLQMDFYTGRAGGLQGRRNRRTFRTALKVEPKLDSTVIRLHARDDEDEPLAGYEIHEKELDSDSMTLVGRTDWNGRLRVEPTDSTLRLFYVKNGGAVLARLPTVPGHHPRVVADLSDDDLRLQAEAYIRGVQNAIIDLVAIRELFKARIRMRIESGRIEDARELLVKLRDQPTNETLADDMGRKQAVFLNAVGRDTLQRRKIDQMFTTTRQLLSKHINPRVVRELEAEIRQAAEGGDDAHANQDSETDGDAT